MWHEIQSVGKSSMQSSWWLVHCLMGPDKNLRLNGSKNNTYSRRQTTGAGTSPNKQTGKSRSSCLTLPPDKKAQSSPRSSSNSTAAWQKTGRQITAVCRSTVALTNNYIHSCHSKLSVDHKQRNVKEYPGFCTYCNTSEWWPGVIKPVLYMHYTVTLCENLWHWHSKMWLDHIKNYSSNIERFTELISNP